MPVTVTSAASDTRLARLEDVKAELGITDASSDARLNRLINEASAAIVSFTGRSFIQETITETLGSMGGRLIMLSRTPIVSISSVKHTGTTIDADEYTIEDADAGIVRRHDKDWTSTRVFDYNLVLQPTRFAEPDWEFQYVAGYVLDAGSGELQLPEDIQRATIEAIKASFLSIGRDPQVISETADDDTIRYANTQEVGRLPKIAMELARAYMRLD